MGSFKNMAIIRRRLPTLADSRPVGRSLRQTIETRYRSSIPSPLDVIDPPVSVAGNTSIRLGSLEVVPGARAVYLAGVAVDLGGRAFDLLMVLLDARGEIVAKDDLLRLVWPAVTVIESNLKVQLSLLRRALGAERWRVKTISGRGYLLIADDAHTASAHAAAPVPVPVSISPQTANQPLVIVVDADRTTQEMVVRALSGVAHYFDGATRVFPWSGDHEQLAVA